eukprot:XP_001704992.1 Hypothetical protein GL50803_39824 [Giardia lamblia ATCC 50803]
MSGVRQHLQKVRPLVGGHLWHRHRRGPCRRRCGGCAGLVFRFPKEELSGATL